MSQTVLIKYLMKWTKNIIVFAGISVSVYVLVIVLWTLSPIISDFLDRTDFDSSAWISWEENEFTQKLRWNMIHDLTNHYDLESKSVSEIQELLGPPDWQNKDHFGYFLGLTGHGINTGSLEFKYDDERIIEYRVWQG